MAAQLSILFDVETTGLLLPSTAPLGKQPHIIELGALKVCGSEVVGELQQLLRVPVPVSKEITKITGISPASLEGQPTFAAFLPQLAAFFAGAAVLFAHNAPFDTAMLRHELARAKCADFPWPKEIICTVQEHLPLFGYRPSLAVLYKRVMGEELVQTHRGLADVKALHAIICKEGVLVDV